MTASAKARVGIIGAAGLSAGKLMEILARHPRAEVAVAVSESSPGKPVHTSHPRLRGVTDLRFEGFDAKRIASCDVVFSCKKAGETFRFVAEVLAGGAKFIDLSGDYRLKADGQFEKWYKTAHSRPGELAEAVYGLPELHRSRVRGARLIANPGCYTTTSILACAPIVEAGLAGGGPVLIDAISGVSGAGRGAKEENLYIHVAENVRAYRIGNHQHTPEIEQELTALAPGGSGSVTALFVPHVGPFRDGILASCYLRPANPAGLDDRKLHEILSARYAGEPFVRVYEPGHLPQVEFVRGTNYCDLGAAFDSRTGTIVVVSVTDNLVKGAAGQAVQNMNLVLGFEETDGLLL